MSCISASTSDVNLRAGIALVAGIAALAGCADEPRLAPPRVAVDSVRLERITGAEASFIVTLSLGNPNAREIAVDGIEANLTVEETSVGTASLRSPLRLPANGDATANLQVRAGLAAVLRLAADLAQRSQEQKGSGQPTRVRYGVSGVATLEGGLPVPFARTGEFRMGTPAK
jgi:LEA14-like dessication related protein